MRPIKKSTSWPTTIGRVISSKVSSTRITNPGEASETRFRAAVSYQYTVNGSSYHSSKISFVFSVQTSPNSSSRAKSIVKKYPRGKEVKVFYNPEKPEIAVLEAGTSSIPYFYHLFGIGFMLISSFVYMMVNIAWGMVNESHPDH